MDKTAKVTYLSLMLIVGFAASVVYNYVQGAYFGRPYPYSTFLFDPAERGGDFSDVLRDGHTLSPYVQYASAQYPFLALLGFALAPLGGLAYPTFVLLVTASHLALSAASLRMATVASTLLHVFVIALLLDAALGASSTAGADALQLRHPHYLFSNMISFLLVHIIR